MNMNYLEESSSAEIRLILSQAISRYWKLVLSPAVAIFALVVVYAASAPSQYTSDTLIFIQPQRISSKIVQSPDKAQMRERLEALVQEILSRPRLKAVIERYKLYPALRGPSGLERAVAGLRKTIKISPITSPTGIQLLQTFRLQYTNKDPRVAFQVTKALTNLFIEESIVNRRSDIQSTEEFLGGELREARSRLETTENEVQKFVSENYDRLPQQLEASIARLESLQKRIVSNSQLISANTLRRSNLQTEYNELLRSRAALASDINVTAAGSPEEALSQLESALIVLTSKYSDAHPDVVRTRNRIAQLKTRVSDTPGTSSSRSYTAQSTPARLAKRSINELNVQIGTLNKENTRLKTEISDLQEKIEQMPIKEQELLRIKRDYKNIKGNYTMLLDAKEQASLENSLVRSQKGSQFRIVEPAQLPMRPSGPPRKLITLGGLAAGLILFALLIVGLYFLNQAFKNREELEEDLGVQVIGIIPPIPTPDALKNARKSMFVSASFSFLAFAGGSVAILLLG